MVFYTSTCTHRKVWYKVKNDNHRKDGEKFEKCGITSKFRNPGFHGQYWTFMPMRTRVVDQFLIKCTLNIAWRKVQTSNTF